MLNKSSQEVKRIKEDDLKRVIEFLKLKNKVVFYSFLITFRILDLRSLYFEDIIDNRYIEIKETKTKKRIVVLNSSVQKNLK